MKTINILALALASISIVGCATNGASEEDYFGYSNKKAVPAKKAPQQKAVERNYVEEAEYVDAQEGEAQDLAYAEPNDYVVSDTLAEPVEEGNAIAGSPTIVNNYYYSPYTYSSYMHPWVRRPYGWSVVAGYPYGGVSISYGYPYGYYNWFDYYWVDYGNFNWDWYWHRDFYYHHYNPWGYTPYYFYAGMPYYDPYPWGYWYSDYPYWRRHHVPIYARDRHDRNDRRHFGSSRNGSGGGISHGTPSRNAAVGDTRGYNRTSTNAPSGTGRQSVQTPTNNGGRNRTGGSSQGSGEIRKGGESTPRGGANRGVSTPDNQKIAPSGSTNRERVNPASSPNRGGNVSSPAGGSTKQEERKAEPNRRDQVNINQGTNRGGSNSIAPGNPSPTERPRETAKPVERPRESGRERESAKPAERPRETYQPVERPRESAPTRSYSPPPQRESSPSSGGGSNRGGGSNSGGSNSGGGRGGSNRGGGR